jgi:hypothetical protein
MMHQYGRRQGDGPQHCGEEKVLMATIGGYAVAVSSERFSKGMQVEKVCQEGVAIDCMYEEKER